MCCPLDALRCVVRKPIDWKEYRAMCVAMRRKLIRQNRRSAPHSRKQMEMLRLIAKLDQILARLDDPTVPN